MILALKLILTPVLISAASLAGRRWGPDISGWLVGLPLTSGPVSLILALQNGVPFAAAAAVGTIGGQASVCVFCLAYCVLAPKTNWLLSSIAASGVFIASTLVWSGITLPLLPTFGVLLAAIVLVRILIPQPAGVTGTVQPPRWDLPARIGIATLFVVALTTASTVLGPHLSGLISPFPVFTLILAAFAHQQQGANAAIRFIRGVVLGSISFGCFFLVAGALLPVMALGWVYGLSTAATLAVNGVSLLLTEQHRLATRRPA